MNLKILFFALLTSTLTQPMLQQNVPKLFKNHPHLPFLVKVVYSFNPYSKSKELSLPDKKTYDFIIQECVKNDQICYGHVILSSAIIIKTTSSLLNPWKQDEHNRAIYPYVYQIEFIKTYYGPVIKHPHNKKIIEVDLDSFKFNSYDNSAKITSLKNDTCLIDINGNTHILQKKE